MNSAILRRLAALQAFADRQRPTRVMIHYIDGTSAVTDHIGALSLLRELGPRGVLSGFQADGPMSEWARLLTVVLHPAKNRRIEDYET